MVDLCEATKNILLPHFDMPINLYRFEPKAGPDGIYIRQGEPRSTSDYYDFSQELVITVEVIVRNRSEEIAKSTAWDVRDVLTHAPTPSLNDSYRWTSTEVYTEPQALMIDNNGRFIWNFQANVKIERG